MKHSARLFLLILAVLFVATKTFSVPFSGKCEINGVVKDSINGGGLPFATIQMFTKNDSVFVVGTTADGEGKYEIKNVESGEYIISASYMGFLDMSKQLSVQSKKVKCDFSLVQKSIDLSEISIIAEKNMVENSINKTTINVSKDLTVAGGTATDVMQTLPSVDFDINGNLNYRGSDRVTILINGEKSELAKSLDQIPANQIKKVEIINNPSAKYEADGMSGIINIVLKTGESGNNKTTINVFAGYPETIGGNVGYSAMANKTRFFINGGAKHNTKFQTKEHLRMNYENPDGLNYYQYDRQDQNLNSAFINSTFEYALSKKQQIGVSAIASKKFDNATRLINYETLNKSGQTITETLKDIYIDLNNYTLDGNLNYKYRFDGGGKISSKVHYSYFDQLQEMNNKYYYDPSATNPDLQNTYSKQINKQTDFSLDYQKSFNDSTSLEAGYYFDAKDLMNDFVSESYNSSEVWINDTSLSNNFEYTQVIHAAYVNINAKFKFFELQAGLRSESTKNSQDNENKDDYVDLFPSVKLSKKLNTHLSVFASYNRRINRPTIKMLNPFSDEYADLLNMHIGNPDLKPEYVNSIETGTHFVFEKISGMGSVYYRHIDQAITRVKSANNDSALYVTFINLDKATLFGSEISFIYKPLAWWNINLSTNIFYTSLSGSYAHNHVSNNRTGWTLNLSNSLKLPNNFGFRFSGYYRSKLPSVMGTYKERYYFDLALNKKILKNKAQLIFKISDVFNTYKYGLDLDAVDENNYRYSQKNRRKNESQYFILSFVYNINGKDEQKKKQARNFFLDDFDK